MPEQPDFWPLMAPKSDPDFPVRERWCRALLILGAIDISGLMLKAVRKWVENPHAADTELVEIICGRGNNSKMLAAEALEFLAEKGLIDV